MIKRWVIFHVDCPLFLLAYKMYGKSSLESNWPEPFLFPFVQLTVVMDRVGSHVLFASFTKIQNCELREKRSCYSQFYAMIS